MIPLVLRKLGEERIADEWEADNPEPLLSYLCLRDGTLPAVNRRCSINELLAKLQACRSDALPTAQARSSISQSVS